MSGATETGSEGAAPPGSAGKDGARGTGPALESHYRFLLWLVPAVERFPRSQKFLLGDRIQRTALDVLESLIDATYTRQRGHHLARANLGLEKLHFLFRLAHDLHALDHRRCGRPPASGGSPAWPQSRIRGPHRHDARSAASRYIGAMVGMHQTDSCRSGPRMLDCANAR